MVLNTVDVAVVGAGPAGSASALRVLQLWPEARVVLLDAAAFPRDKTCGDGVAAHVFDLLDALGVPDLRLLGPAVPGLRMRSPGGQVVARRCARPNHPIPRAVFDVRLVEAAVARGALLRRHRVRSLRIEPDCVVLDDVYAAGVVIGADGANSVIRRLIGAPCAPPRSVAVAIRGYAPTTASPDEMVIEFARRRYPSYAWAFPLAGGGPTSGTACSTGAAPGRAGSCWPPCTTCCPDSGPTPRPCVRTTYRCQRADGTIPTGGCYWPVTRPHWSTR